MANNLLKTGILCVLSLGALASAANAGGFSRGEADTDILFEEGSVAARAGVTYVSPERQYETINGVAATDAAYSNSFWIPSFAVKFKLADNPACALTYTQPFGADATYGPQAQAAGASIHKEFVSNEFGATCDVNMDAGKGRVHFLGGVFMQDFSYLAESRAGTLHLDDHSAFGYRFGVAYEITEYALRAQLMYRSKVEHDADDGSFDWNPALLPFGTRDAYGSGTLPQSLKFSLQSGIAPGWLVYGSVKWTDWSVLERLNYSIYSPAAVPALGLVAGYNDRTDVYNWKDGWTLQAGLAHAFTENVSGTVNLTWDSGVSTGADIVTDSWTVGAGALIKAGPGELRVGGAVTYLTSGSQAVADQALYNATAGGDWSYAVSGSYRIKF